MLIEYMKKGFWPLSGKVFTTLFSLLLIGMLSRQMTLVDFGYYNLAITLFFLFLNDYGLSGLMLRELGKKSRNDHHSALFFFNIFFRCVALTAGLVFSMIYYHSLLLPFFFVGIGWTIYYLQEFRKTILYSELKTFEASVGEVLNKGFILFFSWIVLVAASNESVSLLPLTIAFFLGNGVSYLYVRHITLHKKFCRVPHSFFLSIWKDYQPILILTGLGVAISRIDVLLLDWLSGPESVGLFNIAERIRMSLVFIPATFLALLTPRFSESTDENYHIISFSLWRRSQFSLLILTLMGGLVMVGVFLFSPLIVQLLVGHAKMDIFSPSVTCLRILSISGIGVFLSIIFQGMITVLNQQKKTVGYFAIAFVIKILSSLVLIPPFDAVGAAISDLLTYLYCGIGIMVLYVQLYHQEIHGQNSELTPGKIQSYFKPAIPISLTQEYWQSASMKVILLIDTMRSEGAQVFLTAIARKLYREKISVLLVSIVEKGPLFESLKADGIPVIFLGKPGLLSISPLFKLLYLFKTFPCDIVHTNLFAADTYGRIAARLAGVKTIITTEHNINRDEIKLKKRLKSILSSLNSVMVFLNEHVYEYARDVDKVKPKDVAIIGNGVNLELFGGKREKQLDHGNLNRPVILSVGRLELQKGHDIMIRAISSLLPEFPTLTLTIIGKGSQEETLQRMIESLNMQKIVTFIHTVNHTDMPQYYTNADIFVFPSRFEGEGIALLEAMASGLPIVASKTGGIQSLLEHQKSGWLVGDLSPDALAAGIREMLNNGELRVQLGKEAAKIVKTHSIDETFDKYLSLYTWTIGEKREKPPFVL